MCAQASDNYMQEHSARHPCSKTVPCSRLGSNTHVHTQPHGVGWEARAGPPTGLGLTPQQLERVLPQAAFTAAQANPPCSEESPIRLLTTRQFIDTHLKEVLVKALQQLDAHRPPSAQILPFLLAVLEGKPAPTVAAESRDAGAEPIFDYLVAAGARALLKPALVCCARHRPANPRRYVSLYLSAAISMLKDPRPA
eukprot:SAG22_NODE_1919_length_3308_cov_9.137738_3_plen_196_part_00